jgi:hypothetical protein
MVEEMRMKTKHTKESIQDLLAKSDAAVERAMVAIYDRQTQDEKATSDTRHTNQRGFSGAHASKGSYYARWVLGGRHLTGSHLAKARAMSMHYWRQLLEVAEAKTAKARKVEVRSFPRLESVADVERYMQQLESEGDREQTIREETAKEEWKASVES